MAASADAAQAVRCVGVWDAVGYEVAAFVGVVVGDGGGLAASFTVAVGLVGADAGWVASEDDASC
ncbi:hypothetical protein ACFXKC_30115 [Streptomyces sp. NPDC059340]|uniref:hypothetical protein n=1 Tax=Streptomyces sp. NPDC059340 TaxID=3346806 RepID=UPI0036801C7C